MATAAPGSRRRRVRAYAGAQLGAPSGCDLGRTTLAGIGWVESQHGTLGGRTCATTASPRVRSSARRSTASATSPPSRPTRPVENWHGDPGGTTRSGRCSSCPPRGPLGRGRRRDGRRPARPRRRCGRRGGYLCARGRDLTGAGWSVRGVLLQPRADLRRAGLRGRQAYAERTRSPALNPALRRPRWWRGHRWRGPRTWRGDDATLCRVTRRGGSWPPGRGRGPVLVTSWSPRRRSTGSRRW